MSSPLASLEAQRTQRGFTFNFLRLRSIDLNVCRPLNGKHKTTILCALCGSAVKLVMDPFPYEPFGLDCNGLNTENMAQTLQGPGSRFVQLSEMSF